MLWNGDVYEFNRLVFGVNASPFLAHLVSQVNAKNHADTYPMAADTVLRSTYMDDSMDSVYSEDEGIELYYQLSNLWKKAGMYARKWLSNSVKVLEQVPEEDRASEVDLDTGYLPTTKALGVVWKANSDTFTFKLQKEKTITPSLTKRNLLKSVASVFDPLGFLSPYLIQGKIFIQKLWLSNYDWDDIIESDVAIEIEQWLHGLSKLNNVSIPRSLAFDTTKDTVLHVFVDASEEAYAAVLYVRHVDNEIVTTKFVCSKTRVAPLSSISIPRLELMGAVLGLRIAMKVAEALEISKRDILFWTDSANVLHWIAGQSRHYKPFVSHRIGEIHENSLPVQWRHIPGKNNPADIASRGVSAENLVESELWWNGPEFFQGCREEWPENLIKLDKCDDSEIKRNAKVMDTYVIIDDGTNEDRLDPERFSDWFRLLRVTAWVKRFINNCRTKTDKNKSKELTVEEVNEAELTCLHQAQKESYRDEYDCLRKGQKLPSNSKLLPLNVKLDENGIIRCDTRLKYANVLSYNARFPIVLPRKNHVTKLIVKHYHEQGGHYGTNQTLASLSSRYWIVSAREEIREWEKQCSVCKKQKAHAGSQFMAPLPTERLNMSMRAFTNCSVDFAGPFMTMQGRGKARQKRYLCLFTCMETRAVHLEITYSLDTDSFLNAFYRMASRRGFPSQMFSDNGTNFVGACRELKELVEQFDKDKMAKSGTKNGVNWHFNPPYAPHFGGIHESMIKSAKRAVYKVLNGADITDEELLTAFVGAEGLINSRPLCYQTANPSDDCVLTPNHFLHGQLGGQFAPETVDTTSFDMRKRWKRVQEIVKHFWHRWLCEFLPMLSGRKKWLREQRDFGVGDIVLVIDQDKPRGHWSLGIITEVFPGRDKHVRVVNVRIGQTIIKRSVTRLCLIEKHEDYE